MSLAVRIIILSPGPFLLTDLFRYKPQCQCLRRAMQLVILLDARAILFAEKTTAPEV